MQKEKAGLRQKSLLPREFRFRAAGNWFDKSPPAWADPPAAILACRILPLNSAEVGQKPSSAGKRETIEL